MHSSVYIETSIVSYLTVRPSRDLIIAFRDILVPPNPAKLVALGRQQLQYSSPAVALR